MWTGILWTGDSSTTRAAPKLNQPWCWFISLQSLSKSRPSSTSKILFPCCPKEFRLRNAIHHLTPRNFLYFILENDQHHFLHQKLNSRLKPTLFSHIQSLTLHPQPGGAAAASGPPNIEGDPWRKNLLTWEHETYKELLPKRKGGVLMLFVMIKIKKK